MSMRLFSRAARTCYFGTQHEKFAAPSPLPNSFVRRYLWVGTQRSSSFGLLVIDARSDARRSFGWPGNIDGDESLVCKTRTFSFSSNNLSCFGAASRSDSECAALCLNQKDRFLNTVRLHQKQKPRDCHSSFRGISPLNCRKHNRRGPREPVLLIQTDFPLRRA